MLIRLFCLIVIALLLQVHTAPGNAATESGWILEQKSKVSGEHQIYFSPTRIKSVNRLSRLTMYTSAPDWKIVILNDVAKTYWITDVAHLIGTPSARVFTGLRLDMTNGRWFTRPANDMLEQKTIAHYLYRKPAYLGPMQKSTVFEIAHVTGVTSAVSYCLVAAPMSDSMSKFVSQIYAVAPLHEFPLRVMYKDAQGIEVASLLTKSIRPTKIKDSLFAIPPGYKKAKDENAVYEDERSKKAMQESFEWLGEVDKTPSQSKSNNH